MSRRYFRYVVARMHNCPFPYYCTEFWDFFERRKILPRDYYNIDGICPMHNSSID